MAAARRPSPASAPHLPPGGAPRSGLSRPGGASPPPPLSTASSREFMQGKYTASASKEAERLLRLRERCMLRPAALCLPILGPAAIRLLLTRTKQRGVWASAGVVRAAKRARLPLPTAAERASAGVQLTRVLPPFPARPIASQRRGSPRSLCPERLVSQEAFRAAGFARVSAGWGVGARHEKLTCSVPRRRQ